MEGEQHSTGHDRHRFTRDAEKYVEDEARMAMEQLATICKPDPPRYPLGQMNPKALKAARGVFFMHTRKLGLGVGVKWGRGWLLMRTALDPPQWSAPVFYNVKEGSFGFTAGVGGNATLIALGTDAAVDAFCDGKAVMGDDISFSLGGSESAPAQSSNVLDSCWKESVAWTVAEGMLLDVSLIGGSITVDSKHNEALYGPESTPMTIIVKASTSGQTPPAFQAVYSVLADIISNADSDPREFKGFRVDLSPHKPSDPSHMTSGTAAPGTPENPLPGGEVAVPPNLKDASRDGDDEKRSLLFGQQRTHQA